MKEKLTNTALYLFVAFMIYVSISGIRYRFAHPEVTETQCVLNFGDLLKWK